VTAGPDVSTVQTLAAGAFQQETGSTGGLVVYGHDPLTDTDYTAALGSTPGGLGSELEFISTTNLALAFDVEVGNFLCHHGTASCPANTLDLILLRGRMSMISTIDVWPNQGGVLRDIDHLTGDLSLPSAYQGVRTYGDIDGDGIDELCVLLDDGAGATTFTCNDVTQPGGGGVGTIPSATPPFAIAGYRAPTAAQLVDVDGDGRLDLVAAFAGDNGTGGGVVVVFHVGSAPDVEVVTTTAANGAIAVNIDADPELEIVAITDAIHLYDLAASGPVELGVIDGGPYTGAITTSDLDGDGVRELIVGQTASSVLVLWPATNTGAAR